MSTNRESRPEDWRSTIFKIIYHADTPAGKWFDILLILAIVVSVFTIILDSVAALNLKYGNIFTVMEWFFTILFTFEYLLRVICIRRPEKYIFSFFGIVDLLSIIPSYLSLFIVGAQHLLVIRVLRILRVFRILKLLKFTEEAQILMRSIKHSRHKIFVFFLFITTVLVVFGSIMYLIEGPEHGFASIPTGIYWAVVTLTTVGYGDVTPLTITGRVVASMIMLIGYSIIAVPTGIFASELNKEAKRGRSLMRVCTTCNLKGHTKNANYCRRCGEQL